MNEAYCTYLDAHYLSRGLALYGSLRAHQPEAQLHVMCMDEAAYAELSRLALPGCWPLRLAALEAADPELRRVRDTRSRVEYYFTCTPALPLHLLDRDPALDLVTYLDADLFFFGDPAPVLGELAGASVGIIAHRFPPFLRHKERSGIYNVGWVSFRRSAGGCVPLQWWRERCLEWCYDRVEPGRYADQKYLDDWPQRFPGVIVLEHPGANVAPWNLARHDVQLERDHVTVDGEALVFFHFHGFRQVTEWLYDPNLSEYGVRHTAPAIRFIFGQYAEALLRAARTAGLPGTPDGIRDVELIPLPLSPETHRTIVRLASPLRIAVNTILRRYFFLWRGRVL